MTSIARTEDIETALWSAAEVVLGRDCLGDRRLVAAIEERSRLYTSERELIDEPSDELADVGARALFYTVADLAKLAVPIAELRSSGLAPESVRMLDLGAGCGAMTWGVIACGVEADEVVAVDRDPRALAIMAEVARRLGVSLRTHVEDLEQFQPEQSFDLIVAGSVLNEIGGSTKLVEQWLSCLKPAGSLVLIEPGSREVARALHRLRDSLIEAGSATVFSPCVRRAAPCPALADPKNWCHEDRPAELPARARSLASRTHLRRHGLKFSYLVLRRDGRRLASDFVDAGRVVSRVRKLKGKWEAFVCSERGRQRVSLLKRHASETTDEFIRARRGDVLRGVLGDRLGADDLVEPIIALRADDLRP